jgi:hypothetical protein
MTDKNQTQFARSFNAMCEHVHAIAADRGWHDEPKSDGDFIALIHGELS